MLDSVHGALEAWTVNPCVELTVTFRGAEEDGFDACPGEVVDDGVHCIYWVEEAETWPYGVGLVAVTLVHHNSQTAEIIDTDMAFNGTGAFTWSSPEVCDPESLDHDLRATLTHEFGHFFGLNHSGFAQSTMEASTRPGDCGKRTLAAMDKECLCDTLATVPGPAAPIEDVIEDGEHLDTSAEDGHGPVVDEGGAAPSPGCQGGVSWSSWPLALLLFAHQARRRRRRAPQPAPAH